MPVMACCSLCAARAKRVLPWVVGGAEDVDRTTGMRSVVSARPRSGGPVGQAPLRAAKEQRETHRSKGNALAVAVLEYAGVATHSAGGTARGAVRPHGRADPSQPPARARRVS